MKKNKHEIVSIDNCSNSNLSNQSKNKNLCKKINQSKTQLPYDSNLQNKNTNINKSKIDNSEICSVEICSSQTRSSEICNSDICSSQTRNSGMCSNDIRSSEIISESIKNVDTKKTNTKYRIYETKYTVYNENYFDNKNIKKNKDININFHQLPNQISTQLNFKEKEKIFIENYKSWFYYKQLSSFKNIYYGDILLHNNKIIGILHENNDNEFIYLINSNDKIIDILNIKKQIGKGTFNSINLIYSEKSNKNLILSMTRENFEFLNKLENKKTEVKNNVENFIQSVKIQSILTDINIRCVPKIYNFFYLLDKANNIHLCKIIDRYYLDGFKYLNKLSKLINTVGYNVKDWLNYLSQIIFKLYLMQKKFKFSHCDLKPNNTMGNYVSERVLKYEITNNNEKLKFYLSNMGIDWVFIDFGFSSLNDNENYYQSCEFIKRKLVFNESRDITLLYFMLLKYNLLPKEIKTLLEKSLLDVKINFKKYEFLPANINMNIEEIYELIHSDNFENTECIPFNALKNINKLIKY